MHRFSITFFAAILTIGYAVGCDPYVDSQDEDLSFTDHRVPVPEDWGRDTDMEDDEGADRVSLPDAWTRDPDEFDGREAEFDYDYTDICVVDGKGGFDVEGIDIREDVNVDGDEEDPDLYIDELGPFTD
jgi:hypothetical protein